MPSKKLVIIVLKLQYLNWQKLKVFLSFVFVKKEYKNSGSKNINPIWIKAFKIKFAWLPKKFKQLKDASILNIKNKNADTKNTKVDANALFFLK